jgi:hypothetical protein
VAAAFASTFASTFSVFFRVRASSSLTSLSCLCSSSDCFCNSSVWRSSFWIFSDSDIDCAAAEAGTNNQTPRRALHATRFCLQSMITSSGRLMSAPALVTSSGKKLPGIAAKR